MVSMANRLQSDPKLLDTCLDVVIRFKAHGNYKDEAGALKALRRRAPALPPEQYRFWLDLLCRVYDRALSAIERHRVRAAARRSRLAHPDDIDHQACLAELDEIAPGLAKRQKEKILSWVIYWHYLR